MGLIVGIQGTVVLCADGKNFDLTATLGEDCIDSNGTYELIRDLINEKVLLRLLVKELVRRLGVRIVDPNSFYRDYAKSFADKVGADLDDLYATMRPILVELVNEMTMRPKAGGGVRHYRNGRQIHPNDSRQQFLQDTLENRHRLDATRHENS